MRRAIPTPTSTQWEEADSFLPQSWTPCQDAGEVWCVLDAAANDEDPCDALAEYRYWRSPAGRRQESDELFDSAHPLSDLDR